MESASPMGRHSLAGNLQLRLTLLLLAMFGAAALVHGMLVDWPLPALLRILNQQWRWTLSPPAPGSAWAIALTLLLTLPLMVAVAGWAVAPLRRLLRALQGAVLSYREGDFSMSIRAQGEGDFGELLRLHSELGSSLRDQRQQIAQRELLLDAVVQNTPLALLLIDTADRVIYANIAARQLLCGGRSPVGQPLDEVLAGTAEDFRAAMRSGQDQLFSVADDDGHDEHFHLSQRHLLLQGTPHRLILLRRMTRELAREEVASWKRVIRVISHELNNSLAPISSMAHSGAELARRGQADRLPPVFDSIAARAAHLHAFLAGYAQFAKLPQPRGEWVEWPPFISQLATHACFSIAGELPQRAGWFDPAQMEQALLNLLKNAHESGGASDAVSLSVTWVSGEWRFVVADRGPGMSETVLAQALLPFYSTKRSGTGLGLALAREIAEAHGGRIALANRDGGGLQVTLTIPDTPPGHPSS